MGSQRVGHDLATKEQQEAKKRIFMTFSPVFHKLTQIYTSYIIFHYPVFKSTINSVQFSSVAQSCPTLCDPMNRSTPGLPVRHQHLEFTQAHVHQVGDAIKPFHSLSFPSPHAPNHSKHQSLFQ